MPANSKGDKMKPNEFKVCETCKGTGKEICDNPDHGGIESGLFGRENNRLGCPVCGYDEDHAIKNSTCPDCHGTGKVEPPACPSGEGANCAVCNDECKVEPPAVIVIPPEDKRIPALQISIMIDAIKKDLEREHNVYFTERMKQILEQLVCVHNTIMGVK